MLRKCVGIKGKGCSRFIANWDNHSLCFACRVLARNVALAARALTAREPMAPVLCTVIAVVLGGMVVQTTGLDEASAPVRAVAPLLGATDLNHKAGIGLDLIQDQTIPILCPENQGLGT